MTGGDWLSKAATLILAVTGLGSLSALVLIPRNRRRLAAASVHDGAEAVQLLTNTAVSTVTKLQEQLEQMGRMREQLDAMRGQLAEAEDKTRQLIRDLDAANTRARVAEEEVARLRGQLQDELARRRRQPRRRADEA
jgi:TolA-binding protein